MGKWEVSREAARRFLLEGLLLGPVDQQKPEGTRDIAGLVTALDAVQIDPVARVGRNQDLVLRAREPDFKPEQLDNLLRDGLLFEYRAQEASVLPMGDYPIFAGVRQRLRERLLPQLNRYPEVVRHIQDRLIAEGPLPARAFVSRDRVQGYWDTDQASTKVTSHVLNLLYDAGLLMVARRQGVTRVFDIPERVVPEPIWQQSQQMEVELADRALFDKFFRAYHLVRGRHQRLGWSGRPMTWRRSQLLQRTNDRDVLEVTIDGCPGPYYLRQEAAPHLEFWASRTEGWDRPIRFLPPLDNLLWDRDRLSHVFGFYYRWEVYVPASKRNFGAYAMPILAGDRLVGRIDPELRRDQGQLVIHRLAFEQGVRVTARLRRDVQQAAHEWASRMGATRVQWPADPTA